MRRCTGSEMHGWITGGAWVFRWLEGGKDEWLGGGMERIN